MSRFFRYLLGGAFRLFFVEGKSLYLAVTASSSSPKYMLCPWK